MKGILLKTPKKNLLLGVQILADIYYYEIGKIPLHFTEEVSKAINISDEFEIEEKEYDELGRGK